MPYGNGDVPRQILHLKISSKGSSLVSKDARLLEDNNKAISAIAFVGYLFNLLSIVRLYGNRCIFLKHFNTSSKQQTRKNT